MISISAKKLARDLKRTSRLIFVSSASTLSDLLEPQTNQLYIAWMELLQRQRSGGQVAHGGRERSAILMGARRVVMNVVKASKSLVHDGNRKATERRISSERGWSKRSLPLRQWTQI